MTNVLDLLTAKRYRTEAIGPFTVDPNDSSKVRRAKTALNKAKAPFDAEGATPTSAQEATLAEAQAAWDALVASVPVMTFHLRAISPSDVTEMIADHQPTTKQARVAKAINGKDSTLQWNPDTFPPALLAEVVTRIEVSTAPDDAIDNPDVATMRSIYEAMEHSDRDYLTQSAMMIHQGSSLVGDLGKD